MAVRFPQKPEHDGKNATGKDVPNGKGKKVAGSKKNISGKRKVAEGKKDIKKA
jgi:hypothetical protein